MTTRATGWTWCAAAAVVVAVAATAFAPGSARAAGRAPAAARGAAPAPARTTGNASPREVLAYFKVAVGKLSTVAGQLRVTYSAAAGRAEEAAFHRNHVARFWFARPFKLKVASSATPSELYYADYLSTLYYPERRQAVTFDLTLGGGELVRRFFALFEIAGFLEGTLLTDVEAQFGVAAEERPAVWRVTFETRPASLYRLALGLDRIEVILDKRTRMPRRMDLFEEEGGSSRQLCTVELEDLRCNVRIPDATFVFKEPPGTTHIPSSEVLREWVFERLASAGQQRTGGIVDDVKRRLSRFTADPWNFGGGSAPPAEQGSREPARLAPGASSRPEASAAPPHQR